MSDLVFRLFNSSFSFICVRWCWSQLSWCLLAAPFLNKITTSWTRSQSCNIWELSSSQEIVDRRDLFSTPFPSPRQSWSQVREKWSREMMWELTSTAWLPLQRDVLTRSRCKRRLSMMRLLPVTIAMTRGAPPATLPHMRRSRRRSVMKTIGKYTDCATLHFVVDFSK